jgi:hypothetical protein
MAIDVSDLELPGLCDLPGSVDGQVPGWALHRLLDELDPATLRTDHEVLDYVAAAERLSSAAQARKLTATAEFVRRPEYVGPDPSVPLARRGPLGVVVREQPGLELAARLGMAARTADRLVSLAARLVDDLAATMAALGCGRIDVAKALVIEHDTATCGPHVSNLVQQRVLPRAGQRTPTQLRRHVQRAVLAVDPQAAAERCARSRADRWVRISADGDDMAILAARIPVETAAALDRALDHAARRRAPGDPRTADQRRADALVELLLRDHAGIRAVVQVTVPAAVLAGLSDQPAELVGHGPITAHLARLIATDATWRRLLTDPATGQVTDVSPTTYRPGTVLRRHVQTRDGTCVAPTCARPAHACDTDHTIPWPAGPTTPDNLASYKYDLCCRPGKAK